jgi:CBS domain-containing protein
MRLGDTVRDVLDRKGNWVCSVTPETSVLDALEVMAEQDIGALIVLSQGELCGVFTERDYARKVILSGKSSKDTPVGEIMSAPSITVNLETDVDVCMHLMTRHRIRYLPVMDGELVQGMISIGDVVNWTIQQQVEQIEHLNHYIAGAYPA